MVKEYMDRFNLTQDEAAKRFGKKRTWVTDLLGFLPLVDDLLGYVGAPTLGWDQLRALKASSPDVRTEVISELKQGKLRPEKVEKRCNQLRFGGGKGSKSNPGQVLAVKLDPLADVWPSLMSQGSVADPAWGVNYGHQQLPTAPGAPINAWHFWVQDRGLGAPGLP
jgi:hypothetical protein